MPNDELNVTDSDVVTDNSNVELDNEPSTDDNSQNDNSNQEPEHNNEDDNTNTGSKFATLEEATKSYSELQKKLGQQSNELGTLRKSAERVKELEQQLAGLQLQEAQTKGFETVRDYQNSKEIAKNTADVFAKYINEVEFPAEMIRVLDEYRKNPSDELLEQIEAQFSVETIKKVAEANAIFKGQLQAKENEALKNQIEQSAQQYLEANVGRYSEEFNNPAFAALYGEAFRAYGCDLDTDKFVELMHNYADAVIKAHGIKSGINNENTNDTDEISGLTLGGNANSKSGGKSLLDMSEAELDKALDRLI